MNSPTISQIKKEILEIVGDECLTVRLKLEKYLENIVSEGRIVGGDCSLQTIDIEVENNPSGLTIGQKCLVVLPK